MSKGVPRRAVIVSNKSGPIQSLSTSVPTSLYVAFDAIAKREGTNKGALLRRLVEDAVSAATPTSDDRAPSLVPAE